MNEQLDIEIAILKKTVADQQEEIHRLQVKLKEAVLVYLQREGQYCQGIIDES